MASRDTSCEPGSPGPAVSGTGNGRLLLVLA
jgi:hypothetical protein